MVPSSCMGSKPKMYPRQTTAAQGEAELRVLDFETTWSEFHKPSQTAATRGEAELCILDLKTTWSDFQKPYQTAVNLKKPSPPQSWSQAVVYISTPRVYPRSGYFLVNTKSASRWLSVLKKNSKNSIVGILCI